jgi:glutaredoxin-like YruB-family protein
MNGAHRHAEQMPDTLPVRRLYGRVHCSILRAQHSIILALLQGWMLYFSHMKTILIYSTPTCPWCHKAKEYFKEKNVAFTDYNVAEDQAKAQEMITKSKQMGVPVIDIEGDIIIGFDKSRIDAALGL